MKRSSLAAWALSATVLLGHLSAVTQDSGAQAAAPPSSQGSMNQNSMSQDIDLLRKDIRSQKKQLIAANMPLTDTEAQKFWPVYDQYIAELVKINNDKYALIQEYATSYGSMTDAQADNWSGRVLKVDAEVTALRQSYWPKFRGVLPAKKAALYEQIERRAQMLIDIQLASQVPLVEP
jgi:Spy/CpxP family protein refolding chaperone